MPAARATRLAGSGADRITGALCQRSHTATGATLSATALPGDFLSVHDYKIEKYRCPATIVFTDGRTLTGEIFLHAMSRFRLAPQDPAEFFNDSDQYFVLAPTYDERILVSKSSVAVAETPLPSSEPDDALDGAHVGLGVEVGVIGGVTCAGWLFPEKTPGRARLLDYLNSYNTRFLVLYDSQKTTLVNRNSVAHVRESD
jgi:hypothetical protein